MTGTLDKNQPDNPHSPPTLRIPMFLAFFSTLIFSLFFILHVTAYAPDLPNALPLSLPLAQLFMGLGLLIGYFTVWLVFPQIYSPQTFRDFFPKSEWVGGWHLIIFPILFFAFFPFFHYAEILESVSGFSILLVDTFAWLTYMLFYSVLGVGVRIQKIFNRPTFS